MRISPDRHCWGGRASVLQNRMWIEDRQERAIMYAEIFPGGIEWLLNRGRGKGGAYVAKGTHKSWFYA